MKAALSGVAILALAAAFQSAVVSQIHLLHGVADVVLLVVAAWYIHQDAPTSWVWAVLAGLMVGTLSALPWWLFVVGYSAVAALTHFLRQRLWRVSFFSFFTVIVFGTLWTQGLAFAYLRWVQVAPISFRLAFSEVILPSLLLNLLLALPVYSLMDEWAAWFFPTQEAEA